VSTLRVGTGSGPRPDAIAAGRAAATGAGADRPAGLAVVHATVHHDLPALLSGFRPVSEAPRRQAAAGDVRTIGFHTSGESARTSGVAGVHNATVAAVAL
jgi:hypothetical protein